MSKWAATCDDWDEWSKPGPPFRIAANTWYVGTCGISAILLTDEKGAILIDSGPENAAKSIAKNIKAAGVDLRDVKLLLHSHEHIDHVGGIAELQRLTGARLLVSKRAARAFETGRAVEDDPQLKENNTIPVARVDGYVADGEVIRLGDLELTAIATPGHTPGASSWKWNDWRHFERDSVSFPIVYADSLTPVSSDGYRFSDHPEYLGEFRKSIRRIGELGDCLLLAPHPSAAGMRANIEQTGDVAGASGACRKYADTLGKALDDRLAAEARGG